MKRLLFFIAVIILLLFVSCTKVCECTSTLKYTGEMTRFFENSTRVTVEEVKNGNCTDLNDYEKIVMGLSSVEESVVCVRL